MRHYQSLVPPYRSIVDRLVVCARYADWRTARMFLTATYSALSRHGLEDLDIHPEQDFSQMVAAVIEQLDTPAVAEADQAVVYAVSAEPAHRHAAQAWFSAHPDALEEVWRPLRQSQLH